MLSTETENSRTIPDGVSDESPVAVFSFCAIKNPYLSSMKDRTTVLYCTVMYCNPCHIFGKKMGLGLHPSMVSGAMLFPLPPAGEG
jgi:hypothetical protein